MPDAPKHPRPLRFPISLDTFLRVAFGGKYRKRRMDLYRAYLGDVLERAHDNPNAVDEIIAKNNRDGISEGWLAHVRADIETWRSQQRHKKASKASRARWSQKRIQDGLIKKLNPPP